MSAVVSSPVTIDPEWSWRLSPLAMAERHGKGWVTTRHHAVIDREFRRLLSDPNVDCLIVKAPPRHGKLLADSTPIWTPGGWRLHGDLSVGDLVYSPSGAAVRVLGVGEKSNADRLVTFADGSQIKCHGAHEWYVWDRGRKRYITRETDALATELTMGFCRSGKSRSRMLADYPKPLAGEYVSLHLDPYVLGVWLGDGKQDGGSFCGSVQDVAHIEGEIARRGWTRSWESVHAGTGVRYVGYRGLYPVLRSLGLASEKFIPIAYLRSDVRSRRELLAGIVDTDGSVETGGRVRVVTVSMRLAQDVAHLVRTLGYRASITTQAPHLSSSGIQGRRPVYSVQWSPHDGIPQGTLPRKATMASCVRRRNGIVSIEQCDPEPGNCIEVEGGLYLAGRNLIPTHNSEYLSKWGPAWYLLAHPTKRVMLNSYTMSLAKFNARWVRDTVHRLAPLWRLRGVDPGAARADDWSLRSDDGTMLGGMLASGVNGSQTGRGADLILIDDYLRSAKDAMSETVRDAQWEWLKGTISTRREPGGKIVILACLTGDARVRMGDGSERPIRDVKPGDSVATFDAGRLSVSKVRNHANLGHDDVFQITLASGNTVTGNARHPFLVEEAGVLKWKRLRDLTTGSTIVTVLGRGESGPGSCVSGVAAKIRQSVAGTVCRTTPRRSGKMGTGHRQTAITESTGSSICTASRSSSTTQCSNLKAGSALCADSPRLKPTPDPIKPDDFVSITVTTQERSEGSCVTTAILQQATLKPEPPPLCLLDTLVFTTDQVLEIRAVGREDVFDLEVEGTGSFIANGLVSHNTQWHSDDLIGRLMRHRDEIGLNIRCITLQALREENGTPDPLRRKPGEALWPSRWPAATLEKQKRFMGPFWWAAQYQGNPGTMGSSEWPAHYFNGIWIPEGEFPADIHLAALYCDPSKGKNSKRGDYSAIVYAGYRGGKLHIKSSIDRRPASVITMDMARMAMDLRPAFVGFESNAFQYLLAPDWMAACEDLGYGVTEPTLIENTISKMIRINRLDAWFRNRELLFERSASNELLINQCKAWPFGTHDDGPDGLEGAIRLLCSGVEELNERAEPENIYR